MKTGNSHDRHAAGHAVQCDENRIDAIFSELDQCRLPGAAVGIAVAGRPVYRRGFGLASMELPVALSASIRMRIGSTSKHFVCFALLLLCEEGKASVDDAVGKFLPELHAVVRDVTLRELMNNTSGLRDAHDICWLFSGRGLPVSSEELLAIYRETRDVNAERGASWIYCNGGFLLLTAVIERITGQSLEEVLRERVFMPSGMHDSLLRRWDTDFVPNSATLHMTTPAGDFDRSYMGTALAGEGGIVSTVDDMLRWLAHMDRPVVGKAATWEMMKTPARLRNGTSTGYGCGLITSNYRGVETLHHSGGVLGGNAQMLKVPSAGLDVVVIVNRHDVQAMQMAHRILDACLPALDAVAVAHQAPFATGVYRSPASGRIVQLFAKNAEQFASVDGMDMPIERRVQGCFEPSGAWSYHKLRFVPMGPPEESAALRLSHFGNMDELLPVAAYSATSQRQIAGEYHAADIGVRLVVGEAGESLQLTSHGRFGSVTYRLNPVAERIWRLIPANPGVRAGLVSLDADAAVLRFRCDRLWGLPFERLT